MPKPVLPALSVEDRAELDAWLKEHGEALPLSVRHALEQYSVLLEGLTGSRSKLSQVLVELRRALGILPMSERRNQDPLGPLSNGDGARPKNKREQLELKATRYDVLSVWHRELAKQNARQGKKVKGKLMKMPVEKAYEPTPEEKAEDAAAVRAHVERLKLGDGADPAFESAKEAFMTGAQVAIEEEHLHLPAPVVESEKVKVLDTVVEQRERYDFSFAVRRIVVDVEKKVIVGEDGERHMVSASMADLGPPRYNVTWDFLSNMTVLVVQYAMPMNRLGSLLSSDEKRFTAGQLSRQLRYVASRLAPIYLHLFDLLADSEIITGDDTSSRVIEVSRYFNEHEEDEFAPWYRYRTREAAEEQAAKSGDKSLGVKLARDLGFEFDRRSGDGTKKALHTTTLSGRSDIADPRSLMVLYRSHLGGFGNLLEILLSKRSGSAKKVTVQSDLSTVNLVKEEKLRRRFEIKHVGCASHARRPFALYEHEDPENCFSMLHLFKGLFIHEYGLNIYGRNQQNVLAVRGTDSREMWADIKKLAQEMSTQWSRETKLGDGCRYILRNFDKLTAYLDDPHLDLTNNFSERMLRLEKLIEASSLFRTSLDGRFALDVVRSVLQTAVAARAPLQQYLVSVLKTPASEIEANPERFLPKAWVEREGKHLADGADDLPLVG